MGRPSNIPPADISKCRHKSLYIIQFREISRYFFLIFINRLFDFNLELIDYPEVQLFEPSLLGIFLYRTLWYD